MTFVETENKEYKKHKFAEGCESFKWYQRFKWIQNLGWQKACFRNNTEKLNKVNYHQCKRTIYFKFGSLKIFPKEIIFYHIFTFLAAVQKGYFGSSWQFDTLQKYYTTANQTLALPSCKYKSCDVYSVIRVIGWNEKFWGISQQNLCLHNKRIKNSQDPTIPWTEHSARCSSHVW